MLLNITNSKDGNPIIVWALAFLAFLGILALVGYVALRIFRVLERKGRQ
jgi:hypothetical protein